MRPERKIAQLLKENQQTLSVAESCTGGLLAHLLTNIPGSTEYFQLGIVSYSNESKTKLLKVPQEYFRKYGAVSQSVARCMAESVRKIRRTNFGIGITGIAGPSGGSLKKPVGLTYIAASSPQKTFCKKFIFTGTRAQIKRKAANQAMELVLKFLE